MVVAWVGLVTGFREIGSGMVLVVSNRLKLEKLEVKAVKYQPTVTPAPFPLVAVTGCCTVWSGWKKLFSNTWICKLFMAEELTNCWLRETPMAANSSGRAK